jgi:hypothetical protein
MKFTHVLTVSGIVILLFIVAVSGTMILPISESGEIHSQAPEHSPAIDEDHNLERVDFIHYARPPSAVRPPKVPTCYELMRVSWKSLPVDYVINPETEEPLDDDFVIGAISASAEMWDSNTSTDVFGAYSTMSTAQYGVLDGSNVIAFGKYADSNVIAVTSVWYSRRTRGIVEFDILFNEYFTWGDAPQTEGLQMDVQNIATHELGHAIGLSDIYTTSCSEVTMYGYSWYEETKKRDLEPADITGLQSIYGI